MSPYEFTKSSYSIGNGECVEVATNLPGTVAIRDSKHPTGPLLHLTATTWTTFRDACATVDARRP
ncbi:MULTISPECIES: DUF397 domain-containing protein [unclassified Streptomyces]|uniref:DUF397 domain-containing protein n=1 Tax=unclassified Streptomyces TaxID=2593676 RepID=UPI003818EF0F